MLAFPIEDNEALEAIWERSKSTHILSLELYVEEVPSGNQVMNVTSNPSPTPMSMLTQETQNVFITSPSCTAS